MVAARRVDEKRAYIRARLTVVLAVAALGLAARYPAQADAATTRTQMTITANVVQTVSVRWLYQAATLVVRAQDVERGYVTVRAGSRIQITHTGPCLFEFRGTAPVFSSVSVSTADAVKEFGLEGGTFYRAPATRRPAEITFDYRFRLASGVRPGTHPWPVTLTMLPM